MIEHIATQIYKNNKEFLPKNSKPKFVYFFCFEGMDNFIIRQEVAFIPVYKNKQFKKYHSPQWKISESSFFEVIFPPSQES